jgi:hypothetical protein
VNEEILDGIDNDGDGLIDEDLQQFTLVLNNPTGLYSTGTRIISHSSVSGEGRAVGLDLNGDGKISLPEIGDGGAYELADEISWPGNEIQLIVEVPVCPDCGGAVDVLTGVCKDTRYKLTDVHCGTKHPIKRISEFGSIIFIADANIFTDDLYNLDHIKTRTDLFNLPSLSDNATKLIVNAKEPNVDRIEPGIDDDDHDATAAEPHHDVPTDNRLDDDGDGEDGSPEITVTDVTTEVPGNGIDDNGNGVIDETDDDINKKYADGIDNDNDGKIDEGIDEENALLDNTPDTVQDYDNAMFARALIYYLLPQGGYVLFDEGRHGLDNPYLVPVYKTLDILVFLTSDPFWIVALMVIIGFILVMVIVITRDKESWIHKFNVSEFKGRVDLPIARNLQLTRIRRAMLEKARMSKGLSPEEFKEVRPDQLARIIGDPQLIELVQNLNRTYTREELQMLTERIRRWRR